MKKIQTIVCVITLLMTFAVNPTFAASSANYEVEVGETLRLDISDWGVQCMANGSSYTWELTSSYATDGTNYNEYLSFTSKSKNYAIVKGLKAGELIGIQYTGYYYSSGIRKEFYDAFYVRVVNSGTPSTGPATLEVFPTPQTLKVGETNMVYARQTRAIGGTYFYSEDTSIATVTSGELESTYSYTTAAKITGKRPGKVNIIAKNVNGLTATCEVIVTAPSVTCVSILSSLTLEIGETYTLTPTISPYDAETSYTWTSDNNSVATVSNSGKVTAKSAGVANIKVSTDNGKTATCKVTVNAPLPTEYDIHCHIYENGKVLCNETPLTEDSSFKVVEGSDVTFTIVPDDGYTIDWLWIDYKDVKDKLVNNVLTIKDIRKDTYFTVSFKKEEQPVVNTDNTLALGSVVAYTGTTVAFPISMTNQSEITALQMDLYLPDGISIVNDEEGDALIEMTDRASKNHTASCNRMPDGSYRIICYSTKNTVFSGNSGELLNVMLSVSADINDGDYEISATNIELSDKTGTAYTGQDIKVTVTVQSYMLGDTDNNGKHTINDAVCIINHILNQPCPVFIETAADLDGNGKITINDAVLLISQYILGTQSNSRMATRAASASDGANFLNIEDITMQPGEIKTIEVMMENERNDIKGIQCDITLPQGISFLYDEDVEDYVSATSRIPSKLALSSQMQNNNNTLRVAGVCTGSASIYGFSGSVFTFMVKADENIKEGVYNIKLTNVELSYGEAIDVADRSSVLEIQNQASNISSLLLERKEYTETYDLNGRHIDVSCAKNGIYIVNGKKVYVK